MTSGATTDPRAGRLLAGAAAVIFDLDGVLVDSEPWWHEVRVAWAAAHGRTWTLDDSRACMGLNSRDWSDVMQRRLGLDIDLDEIERAIVEGLVARYAAGAVTVVPGAPAAARVLAADVPVAVASSAHSLVIRAGLRAAGLDDLFGVVVSSDDVATGKPAPDVYLEAARLLGADPARCVVVEDSLNGVLAGRAAGMRVVLVPNPSVPPGSGAAEAADLVVERLACLAAAMPGSVD